MDCIYSEGGIDSGVEELKIKLNSFRMCVCMLHVSIHVAQLRKLQKYYKPEAAHKHSEKSNFVIYSQAK